MAYKDFNEYMECNYYDLIAKHLGPYIVKNKDSFENDTFYKISWIDLNDISYTVSGTTFKELEDNSIEIRTTVDADVHFSGCTRGGRDSDSDTKIYNVFFKGKLDDDLHDVVVTGVSEYSKAAYDKDKAMSQSWLSYIYEERIDDYAEDFLRRNYPKALLETVAVDPFAIAANLGMTIYYAPLGNNVFGKTYFGAETVTVYGDMNTRSTVQIVTTPGTMLINPDVFFMRNIGTAYNTIIHECVHWDRHRKAFILQRLLHGGVNHISCEMVEGEYTGIGPNESALKWMEWQANQLAPRILMPKTTTRMIFNWYLAYVKQSKPDQRFSETLQETVGYVANYFHVSFISAKLRLIEIGYEEVDGVFVYCNGRTLPPYSFKKGVVGKNNSFVVDEENLIRSLFSSPKLVELYAKGIIVYANCMLCFNDPKYIELNDSGHYILTDYALEHVDECCFLFKRKYSANDNYADTYYRRCFLCRKIDAAEFVPTEYDSQHKLNQSKEEMQDATNQIISRITKDLIKMNEEMRGGFAGALNYFIDIRNVTAEELQGRCGVSTVSISGYRNNLETNIEKGTALALCKALNLLPYEADILLERAGCPLNTPTPSNIYVRTLINNHMDDTWEQWVIKLNMFGMAKDWIPVKNPVVKKVLKEEKQGNIEKFL